MKSIKRTCAAVFTACLVVLASAVSAYAAPSRTYAISDKAANNTAVVALAEQLEAKYGIAILYPTEGVGYDQLATIIPEMLKTLDTALETVTPAVVRQVSTYCYERTGRRLTYVYTYADMRGPYGDAPNKEAVTVGSYNSRSARIEIYIPMHEGKAIATGDNPLTIVHEFGHAFQDFVAELHGYYRMEREWLKLMNGSEYGQGLTDKKVFMTEYASTDFYEDFAETFAHAFICNRPGMGFAYRMYEEKDILSPLGKKISYIENLIKRYTANNATALENYRKIYTTPASINEAGIKLSGQHLLFMGMDEPRTVPLILLNNLYVNERQTVWFSNIGGWYCQDTFGNDLVLFPEGTYGNPGKNLLEEALEEARAKKAELEEQAEVAAA